MKKLTVLEINKKIQSLFDGEVLVDWVASGSYINTKQKVTAIHKLFGPWKVSIDKLFQGRNHPSSACRFHSKEELNKEIKKIHQGLVSVDWTKTKFPIFTYDYIYVIDKDYGPWRLKLYSLLKGESHRQRYYDSKKLSQSEVDSRVQEIFKGEVKILWKGKYVKRKSKVTALDNNFGQWTTTVDLLLRGIQHPQRGINSAIEKNTLSIKEIDARIKKLHKGKVSIVWNNEKHTNIKNKVTACDVDFGTWEVSIGSLLKGQGHRQRHISKIKYSEATIDKKLKKIFKNEVWINWDKSGPHSRVSDKIIAVHFKKGEWSTTVAKLLEGHNHPGIYSNRSKGEKELVAWLKSQNLKVKTQSVITHQNKNYEMDIYIPELNLAIEFNGIYYHSEIFRGPEYHISKRLACESQGINLIQIYETEWKKKKDIVQSLILNILYPTKNPVVEDIKPSSSKKWLSKNTLKTPILKPRYKYLCLKDSEETKGILAYTIKNQQLIIHDNFNQLNLSSFWSILETKFNVLSIKYSLDHRLEFVSNLEACGFNNLETKINHIYTDLQHLYWEKIEKPRLLKIYEPGKSLLVKYL